MKVNSMPDQLVRIISTDGGLRATVASTTHLVTEICQRQNTDPTATVALGRLVTAAALMGSLLKGDQRVALSIEGNGPLKKLQAESDASGAVCGTIKMPHCNLPPKDGHFDVANAIGKAGFLHVIKDLGLKEPYRGMVQLSTSEIAEDLTHYFSVSEQTPTSVALGVTLDQQAGVAASGGFLIQALPGCDETVLEQLEETLSQLHPISNQLLDGRSPFEIIDQVMTGIPFKVQTSYNLNFRCNCNSQHVLNMLKTLPAKDLTELALQTNDTEITCEYCKNIYRFSATEIANLCQFELDKLTR
ncbi:MAG: Hsp33 family molecular chaperone HslO [Thermodesulfobacteriota bacterium]|nr:Hsp33 family molecular chaperone HslO [Thermodesulfobacteriota bacterium]